MTADQQMRKCYLLQALLKSSTHPVPDFSVSQSRQSRVKLNSGRPHWLIGEVYFLMHIEIWGRLGVPSSGDARTQAVHVLHSTALRFRVSLIVTRQTRQRGWGIWWGWEKLDNIFDRSGGQDSITSGHVLLAWTAVLPNKRDQEMRSFLFLWKTKWDKWTSCQSFENKKKTILKNQCN